MHEVAAKVSLRDNDIDIELREKTLGDGRTSLMYMAIANMCYTCIGSQKKKKKKYEYENQLLCSD